MTIDTTPPKIYEEQLRLIAEYHLDKVRHLARKYGVSELVVLDNLIRTVPDPELMRRVLRMARKGL